MAFFPHELITGQPNNIHRLCRGRKYCLLGRQRKKSDVCTDLRMEGTAAVNGGEDGRMEDNEKLKRDLMGDAYVKEHVNTKTSNCGVDTMILTETLEALDVGKETAASLQDQEERLSRSELLMDSTQYVLDKARVTLRGMTFLGSIRNFFSEVSRLGWRGDFACLGFLLQEQRYKHETFFLFVCLPSLQGTRLEKEQ